jgi:hypothetical protein
MNSQWAVISVVLLMLSGIGTTVRADTLLQVEGKIYSLSRDEVVIQDRKTLFTIKKDALPPETVAQLEKANAKKVSLRVPLAAITKTRAKDSP